MKRRAGAALAAGVALLTACGGNGTSSKASSAALSACNDMVGIAQEVGNDRQTGIAGSTVDHALQSAVVSADQAAVLDQKRWATFDGYLRTYVADLQQGVKPTILQTRQISNICSQFQAK